MKTNLFKKMTSLFLAIMMLMSIVPMMASAEVSDGKFWQTISTVTMDGFTLNEGIEPGGYNMWQGTKTMTGTLGERTVYLETTTYNCYDGKMAKPNYRIGSATGIDSAGGNADMTNKPDAIGDHYFTLSRYNTSSSWPSPDSSINVANIFDEADVQVGDKVRITAYVWPESIRTVDGSGGNSQPADDSVTDTTFSLWVSEAVGYGPKEIDYNKFYVSNATEGEYIITTVKKDQWNEVVLEYTITEANKSVSSIQMNSDNKTHDVAYYPVYLTLGAVKVEKLAEPNGNYTIEDGKKWQSVNEFDFDGFEAEYIDSAYGYSYNYIETVNDVKNVLRIFSNNGYMNSWTGLLDAATANSNDNTSESYGEERVLVAAFNDLPSVVKSPASANLGYIRRYYNSTKQRYTSADGGFLLSGIYGTYTPQVGEKVRVSAYVYPADAYTYTNADKPQASVATGETEVELTMWLSQITEGTDNDGNPTYSYTKSNSNPGEYSTGKIKVGQWNKVTLEYEINDTNAAKRGFVINNVPTTESATWIIPSNMLIAGVTVEKCVDDATETIGKITGTVAVAPAAVEAGADYRVLVGAYNVVDGEYMMLGCNILPYEADSTYNFAIDNADGATEVKAYLWDFNSFEPQIVPIECTYIAQ